MDEIRHNWTQREVKEILTAPFLELIMRAQETHRKYFPEGTVQVSSLISIKTGSCPEDCKYCPQSIHNPTGLQPERLLDLNTVLERPRRPGMREPPASAWGPPGGTPGIEIWRISPK